MCLCVFLIVRLCTYLIFHCLFDWFLSVDLILNIWLVFHYRMFLCLANSFQPQLLLFVFLMFDDELLLFSIYVADVSLFCLLHYRMFLCFCLFCWFSWCFIDCLVGFYSIFFLFLTGCFSLLQTPRPPWTRPPVGRSSPPCFPPWVLHWFLIWLKFLHWF